MTHDIDDPNYDDTNMTGSGALCHDCEANERAAANWKRALDELRSAATIRESDLAEALRLLRDWNKSIPSAVPRRELLQETYDFLARHPEAS